MTSWRTVRWMQSILAVLMLLFALSFGWAHRLSVTSPPLDLSAYALPDGSLPVLCQTGDQQSGSADHSETCAACRLVHEGLSPPPDTTVLVSYPAQQVRSHHLEVSRTIVVPAAWQARGPPSH